MVSDNNTRISLVYPHGTRFFCVVILFEIIPKTGSRNRGPVFFFMNIIFDYNRTLFNPEINSLYPGVIELLKNLCTYNDLFLVSKNEPGRKDKLEELRIKHYFKKISFIENKTIQTFKEFAQYTDRTCVVGDRIMDEIRLGNQLGFITIWVRQGAFAHEFFSSQEEKPSHIVNDIRELQNIISLYE